MKPYYISLILQSSILIPAAIAAIRFKKIRTEYHPFAILIMAGLLAEIISTILSYTIRNNSYSFNTFPLIEGLLIMWQFHRWHLFIKAQAFFRGLVVFYISFWVIYYIGFNLLGTWYSHFLIFHGFTMVFLTIPFMNKLITNPEGNLWKDPRFIICLGFLFYFTFSSTTSAFYVFDLELSKNLRQFTFGIVKAVNVLSNLLYAIALLMIPRKHEFVLEKHIPSAKKNQLKKTAVQETDPIQPN